MSKPESIKVDPWTDFPRQPYSLFTDDFVHDKLLTLKVNSKNDKSTVNIKATLTADKGAPTISDEAKLWFTVNGTRSIYAKVKSNNYIKLHYDNGLFQQWNSKWNLYATLNSNKSLQNVSLRLGAGNYSPKCNSDNRLRIDFAADKSQNLTWYNRTVVSHQKLTFGLLTAYLLNQNVLLKNNLLFGYKVNDTTNALLRLQNRGFRKDSFNWGNLGGYFDHIKLDFVSKYQSNIQYGLEGVFNVNAKAPFEEALVVLKHQNAEKNQTTKVKVSTKFDVSVSYKYPGFIFKNIANATIGVQGSNLLNDRRAFKFGGQVEFNV